LQNVARSFKVNQLINKIESENYEIL